MAISSRWLSISPRKRTTPRSGRLREGGDVEDGVARPQGVAGADGEEPAQGVEAGGTHAGGVADQAVDGEAHPEAAGVPAAGDQAAVDRFRRAFGVGVEGLWVVLARELQDLGLGEGVAAEVDAFARLEIFQVAHGYSE
ncbi:MAG: hypothetical protein V9E83_05470 [Baekduia sp.]